MNILVFPDGLSEMSQQRIRLMIEDLERVQSDDSKWAIEQSIGEYKKFWRMKFKHVKGVHLLEAINHRPIGQLERERGKRDNWLEPV